MDNYGKGVAEVLRELISGKQVLKVQISRFIDNKLVWESEKFAFGHEFIHVGSESYNLNKLVKYQFDDGVLSLHF